MDIFRMVEAGGFVMYPLLICSIIIWAVVFEKIWFLIQIRKQFEMVFVKAQVLLKEKKINEIKGLCHGVHAFVAAPYSALLSERSDLKGWERRIARRLKETQQGLRRFLWILGTIGAASPFIGLFGTVVGIIKSFDSIAVSGKSGFAVVATGLSEALVATATGIIVAVIAVIFYNYFQTRLSNINLDFSHKLEDLSELLEDK